LQCRSSRSWLRDWARNWGTGELTCICKCMLRELLTQILGRGSGHRIRYRVTRIDIVGRARGSVTWRKWSYEEREPSIGAQPYGSYPRNRLRRPIGLWDVKDPTLSRQSAHS
jgi:hypothetical protein